MLMSFSDMKYVFMCLHDDTHTGSKVTAPSLNCGGSCLFMDTQLDTGEAALFLFPMLILRKNKTNIF